MQRKTERNRLLVAVRPNREQFIGIALMVALFMAAALAIFLPALARAEQAGPPPLVGFTPGEFSGGTDLPAAGQYYFPGGWKAAPANSTVASGEGFPQVTAKVQCKVKVTAGAVNLTCPNLDRSVKGRWKGAVGLTTWPETVAGTDGPVTKLGVFAYFETLSVAGHVYHSSVSGSPKGHDKEMVLQVEPNGSVEAAFEVTFVHQDVAASKPAAGAARPGGAGKAAPTK